MRALPLWIIVCVSSLLLLPAPCAAETARGVVFEDTNGDGEYQSDETGVSGVAVSNGLEVVVGDRQGIGDRCFGNPCTAGDPKRRSTGAGGDPAYIVQTDPYFAELRAWGDTMWELWVHNRAVTTAAPYAMAQATVGSTGGGGGACTAPGTPQGLTATAQKGKKIQLDWSASSDAESDILEYRLYRDTVPTSGEQLIARPRHDETSFTDRATTPGTTYVYEIEAVNLQFGVSARSNQAQATTSTIFGRSTAPR